MFYYIFAVLLGLACPSETHNKKGNDIVYTTNDEGGTGGDTGQVPPRPPKPPHPTQP